jgi:NHL repeat
MTVHATRRLFLIAPVAAILALLVGAAAAQARPVKLIPTGNITNSFAFPESVAVAPNGNLYVSDRGHGRIQELTPSGVFVLMFGWDVNKTKVEANAPQAEKNVCTAASEDECQAGVPGTAAGQFDLAFSLAVDPSDGGVYVQEADTGNYRVDRYTAEGRFEWMIGKEVNATTKANLCTAASKNLCQRGIQSTPGSSEEAAFDFANLRGNLLAVAGPEHLLYVGDSQRVQKFNAAGEYKGAISLTGISTDPESQVTALTTDASGNVFLVDRVNATASSTVVIREFNPGDAEVASITLARRQPGTLLGGDELEIRALALDSEGHLAVVAFESGVGKYGALLDVGTGRLITSFPSRSSGIAFGAGASADLYAVGNEEVIVYSPVNVAELLTGGVSCVPGEEHETDETLACTLNGEVNPWGVTETEVAFQWGRSPALGSETAKVPVPDGEVLQPVSGEVGVVRPNEQAFFFRLVGEDHNVKSPEQLSSETTSFQTPIVAPRIIGSPAVSFVKAASAVAFAELNPENAPTRYEFQYGPCEDLEACPGVLQTPAVQSEEYGKIETTQEITGLQPATTYHYRLLAVSKNAAASEEKTAAGATASFTTGPAPIVTAATAPAQQVAATSAVVSGTVNPDGQPATYTFELGVYAAGATSYGVVLSGAVPATSGLVPEAFTLTGLQPGTTYAYRIAIASGYGTATGQPQTFTTQGLPAVLNAPIVLAQVPLPAIAFPAEVPPAKPSTCKRGYKRDKHSKCVKAKTKKPKLKHTKKGKKK